MPNKKKTGSEPHKGAKRYVTVRGKRLLETYLGGGKWEGREIKTPAYKPRKVKAKTNYKSTGSKKGRPINKRRSK